jgi:hypothetical protein
MKQTITFSVISLSLLTAVLLGGVSLAYAHDGEDHGDAEMKELSIPQMEQMIALLKQVVTLMVTLKSMPVVTSVSVTPDTIQVVPHEEVHTEDHAEDHTDEVVEEKKLIIELEEHHGKTHVHVRYVDKPESMFFIDTPLTNVDGIVVDVTSRTGLGADEVRSALKFLQ